MYGDPFLLVNLVILLVCCKLDVLMDILDFLPGILFVSQNISSLCEIVLAALVCAVVMVVGIVVTV